MYIDKLKYDPSEHWNNISAEAKDLINKCLIKNPSKRFSCDDALVHSWIIGGSTKPNGLHSTNMK